MEKFKENRATIAHWLSCELTRKTQRWYDVQAIGTKSKLREMKMIKALESRGKFLSDIPLFEKFLNVPVAITKSEAIELLKEHGGNYDLRVFRWLWPSEKYGNKNFYFDGELYLPSIVIIKKFLFKQKCFNVVGDDYKYCFTGYYIPKKYFLNWTTTEEN